MSKSYSEITPYIKELAGISNGNNHIKPEMYSEHDVKRGLRDLDGNGVVTGLTEISHIKAKEMGPNGESIPCEGELYFRGYNVRNLVSGFLNKDRFGFEETVYLLLFSLFASNVFSQVYTYRALGYSLKRWLIFQSLYILGIYSYCSNN